MTSRFLPLAFAAAAVVAAASVTTVANAQASGNAAARPAAKPKANRDIITRADLDAKASANLYDVVMSQRSHWLRGSATARQAMSVAAGTFQRADAMAGDPANDPNMATAAGVAIATVYVDGRPFGAPAMLRNFAAEAAEKVCYFPLNRAQGRFGLSVNSAVIEIFTRGSSYAETAC